jgi:hypothetical protein
MGYLSMLGTDFLILNEVRRELIRSRIDFEKIQFSVTRGVVYFWGEFWFGVGTRRLEERKEFDMLVSGLVGLEKRLRSIRGVLDIYFRFNNIHKYGGFWRRARVKARSAGTVSINPERKQDVVKETRSPDGHDKEAE